MTVPTRARPVVVADRGADVRAARGSYCWRRANVAVCADTIDPISFAPRLVAGAESTLTVRMGYQVRRVEASIGGDAVDLRPLGDRRRRYELTLPDSLRGGRADLYLFAGYDCGDGSFAVHIGPR